MNLLAWKRKNVIFWSCFLGHWIYYLNRKSSIYSIPIILNESTMTLTAEHFGIVSSIQMIFYTIGKMLTGIVVDKMSCRIIFGTGMFVVGVANVCYGLCVLPIHFYVVAALNGLFQACAWNVIAVLLKRWFQKTEFGTIWSLVSTSMNVSNSLSPFIVMKISRTYRWRTAFYLIGASTSTLAIVFYFLLKDHPDSANTVAAKGNRSVSLYPKIFTCNDEKPKKHTEPKNKEDNPLSFIDLFKSPVLWVTSLCYCLCCFVKNGIEDWLQFYLITERKFSDNTANFNLMAFQSGGLFCTIVSGIVSDFLVRKLQSRMLATPRLLVVLFCSTSILIWFYLLHFNRYFNSTVPIAIACFFLGLCCYGPHNLFGIIIMENAPMELSGSAHALATTCSSAGLILAGYPLVYISNNYGWDGAFFTLMAVSMVASFFVTIVTQMDSQIVKRKKE